VSRRFRIEKDRLPDLPAMMLAIVEALRSIGGSASIQELDEKVIEQEGVTEAEQSYVMQRDENRPRVNYYLAWARTYLKRGGAIINSSRGIWSLTEHGSKIVSYNDVQAIFQQVQLEERERAREKRIEQKLSAKEVDTTDIVEPRTDTEIPQNEPEGEENWKSVLLERLEAIAPDAFERLAQRLLREAGFTKVEVRGKSGDGGIDGVGVLRVNLVSFQVYFQCKKWKGSVGAKEIRDFRGAMQGRADKGILITTGHFTSQASEEATRDGATAIDLIDGDRLCDLLKENRLGISTEMIERVNIDHEWFGKI